MAARGCGVSRFENGVYACCGLSPLGRPVEHFLIDPPETKIPLGVTPRGVQLFERDGVWHIIDWVGSEGYVNTADFVEEIRELGMSRRLPSNLDFGKLTADSKMLFIHGRAYIENWQEYPIKIEQCPSKKHQRANYLGTMCAQLWWQDVEGGEPANDPSRIVRRAMPSLVYGARRRPDNVTPQYRPAFFMWLPITRLEIIRGDKLGQRMTAASKSKLPVVVKEE